MSRTSHELAPLALQGVFEWVKAHKDAETRRDLESTRAELSRYREDSERKRSVIHADAAVRIAHIEADSAVRRAAIAALPALIEVLSRMPDSYRAAAFRLIADGYRSPR